MFNFKMIATAVVTAVITFTTGSSVVKDGVQLPTELTPSHRLMAKAFLASAPAEAFEGCMPAEGVSCEERLTELADGGELMLHEAALYHYATQRGGIVVNVPTEALADLKKVCTDPINKRLFLDNGRYQLRAYDTEGVSDATRRTFGSFQCLPQKDGSYLVRDQYKVDILAGDSKYSKDLEEGGVAVKTAIDLLGGLSSRGNYEFRLIIK